nr:GNAT family protein [uncultured Clostridium sp.]
MENFRIKTGRLLIRILDMNDKESFFKYRSLPEIFQFQSWKPKSIYEIEEFIMKNISGISNKVGSWLQLAICIENGQMIGDIGVHFFDDYQIEIGYTLSPEYQGRGYAVEAVNGIVNYIFTTLKKHRITASVDPDNLASIKLLEKIGFRKEAHFIKSFYMDNRWYDDCIYSILEDEWII